MGSRHVGSLRGPLGPLGAWWEASSRTHPELSCVFQTVHVPGRPLLVCWGWWDSQSSLDGVVEASAPHCVQSSPPIGSFSEENSGAGSLKRGRRPEEPSGLP